MANAYDALLAQYYTPAHRQQAFLDSLGPLGAGLIAAGAPSTSPAAFSQGISQGLLGMQQTLRRAPQEAFQQAAMASQMATADLQRQQLQAQMQARARIAALFGGGSPPPAGMPGGIPTAGQARPMGAPSPAPPAGSTPGPVSGPPGGGAAPGVAGVGATPPAAPVAAPAAPATATDLQALARRYFQVGAELMAVDPDQGRRFLEMAMQYDPAIKVEMTAAGDMLIKGPDGRYFSAPGVDTAKARRAGLVAGAEAGARNRSELEYVGRIAREREQGKNQGAVAPVNVYGTSMPGTQALEQTKVVGQGMGSLTPVQSPWGVVPMSTAMETAKNFAGRDVDVTQPGTTIMRVPPALGPQPGTPPRQEMTDSGFGMTLPGSAPATPRQGQSNVIAQNPAPHPQTGAGQMQTKLGVSAAESIEKSREVASAAQASLRIQAEAKKLLDSGVITGTGANWRLELGRALATVGLASGEGVANTDAFIATMGRETLNLVKQLGAGNGISNADRDYAERVAGGRVIMTKAGLERLFDINRRASEYAIRSYNSLVEPILNDPRTDPTLRATLQLGSTPAAPAAPAAGTGSVQSWRRGPNGELIPGDR